MSHPLSRRRIICTSAGVALASLAGAGIVHAQAATTQPATQPATRRARPPALPGELVRSFVGAAHGDLEKTRQMLADQPALVNATWDWSAGDFETALGGASHMGRADIATLLLESGARLDIFAAAMLGRLEIVRTACEAFPDTPKVPGPHGIPLIDHARKGGEPAAAVLGYLESLA